MFPEPEHSEFARYFNLAESALWLGIALVVMLRIRPPHRLAMAPWRWLLPLSFAVFGVSDVIESETGAWWHPWWLLVLKAACVLCFLLAWLRLRRKE